MAGFWPLLAGICNEHQADALNSRLFDPNKFWTDIPFATLSKSDNRFSRQGYYWLGGVWAPTNYMVIKGLEKYGFIENSRLASEKYLDALVEVYKYTDTL
ncbi:MAG: trehalase family glycosidase [Coriobacteriia bacterium]|nr:trehalase family glycosidase [Coriobacteriia bacterium]